MAVIWIDRPFGELDARHHDVIGPDDELLHTADAVIIDPDGDQQWGAPMLDRIPGLRSLVVTGTAAPSVDLAVATRRGIPVATTPTSAITSTAEHAIALMMAAGKMLPRHQARLRKATGDYGRLNSAMDFDGATLGLVGFDAVARHIATVAQALGMHVMVHDPFAAPDVAGLTAASYIDLLAASDVVSFHVPVGADTFAMLDAAALERCRYGVTIINVAELALIDVDALQAAVHGGQVANVGLDTLGLGSDHPLLRRDDVIVTPGVARSSLAAKQRMLVEAMAATFAALDGDLPPHLLNPELVRPEWDDLEA